MKSLKKTIVTVSVLALLVSLVLALPAFAKDGRPKGLDDRGPLTKITFIHYKKGYAKPPWAGGGNGKGKEKCYGFLARGAKWKNPESYVINPTNEDGIPSAFVESAITAGVNEWKSSGGEIFGAGSLDSGASYNGELDGVNSTSFGSYSDPSVIAVTAVWGYFSGPPRTRELVEWDILFNEHFTWGDADVNPTLMDLQNIATHELGHSAGMDDLYETTCNLETMYGYSSEGETIKRDLHTGDVAGIQELYR